MKQSFIEIIRMIFGIRRINKKIKLLQRKGYEVKNFISIVSNDNDTDTIVYTSKEFQPMVETFSSKYSFVGPSVSKLIIEPKERKRKLIYISLGTINNKNVSFYKNCINAFKDSDVDVIMSVGRSTDIESLGNIPNNFKVKNSVEQITILQKTDVFVTHSGMNSVNESLYYGVPMVLFPQHSEQRMVANRVVHLGAGIMLKEDKSESIKKAVFQVINDNEYKENATKLSKSFYNAGGSKKAADVILQIICNSRQVDI